MSPMPFGFFGFFPNISVTQPVEDIVVSNAFRLLRVFPRLCITIGTFFVV